MSDKRKCKICEKEHDPAEVRRRFGDVWWLGLYCSSFCYTQSRMEAPVANDDPRKIREVDSGRFPDRWVAIEDKLDVALSLVQDEAKVKAVERGLFTSSHEGYGIIAEEVAELLDAIRMNDSQAIVREAVQVGASGLILAASYMALEGKEYGLDEPEPEVDPDDIDTLVDLLSLTDINVPREIVEEWTPEERQEVSDYAGALILVASDNDDVEVPPTPECLSSTIVKPKTERDLKS